MKTKFFLLVLLCAAVPLAAQVKIHGYVLDADSNAVAGASVRIPGLDSKLTDDDGHFEFRMAKETAEACFLKAGADVFVRVEMEGMVMLDPPQGFLRLPRDADYQQPHTIVLALKGSLALMRSERMLEFVFRQRLNAAIAAKDKEFARQLEIEKEAARLGLSESELSAAVDRYKESLRTSDDLNKQGLAALDDANAATTYDLRNPKLSEAKQNFLEAESKDRRAVQEGQAAEKRLPDIWFNLGQTYFAEARYDSAAYFYTKADSAKPGKTETMHMLAFVQYELAQFDKALSLWQKTLALDSTQHGRKHPEFAARLSSIGSVLSKTGDYAGALARYTEVLEIDESHFGRNHPNVAISLNNIGDVLRSKGDYAGALEKYTEALRIDEDNYGENHPKVAIRFNNIANVLWAQGNYTAALEKYNRALKIFELTLGRTHPQVATVLNNMALVQQTIGDFGGAFEKYTEALKIDQSYFGRNHPNVAMHLNNMAGAFYAKGNHTEALEKYNEALAINKSYFGRDHISVATSLNNIGEVLRAQGNYTGALQKFSEALAIASNTYGATHPNIASALNNIALVLHAQHDYSGALKKHQEALAIDQSYFGRNHPNVAIDLSNIALILQAEGDYAGALANYAEALKIEEWHFGRNHPRVATRLNNIALVYQSLGNYAGALENYNEALKIFEEFLGPDHPNTRTVRQNIQHTWWQSLSEADRWRYQTQSSLARLTDVANPPTDSLRLTLLNQIGIGYIKQAKPDSALVYLEQALPLAQKLQDTEMAGTVFNNLGSAHKSLKNWAEARRWLEQSVAHNRAVAGDSASVLAYTYFHLAGVHHATGQSDAARRYAQQSLALCEQHALEDLRKEVEALLGRMEK